MHRLVATAQNGLDVLRYGGLDAGRTSSPYDVVERTSMYRLRRYFPAEPAGARPPVILIPPMMMSSDVYDVTEDKGAAGVLRDNGIELWVIDFGSPAAVEGGWGRTLADHIVAVDEVVDLVRDYTGRDVHLGGYSQGGMFAYQAAAYRHAKNLVSVVAFGSPVDIVAGLPFGIPVELATRSAEFLADHVFSRLAVEEWMARVGFQLLDPVKTVKSRIDFVRQLHDREALLPREPQRRFLESEGYVPWSGPAVAELLKQFVAHNRMMSGGFVIRDRLVSLNDLTCPVLSFVGEVDDIGQPAAVRGIKRAAPRAEVFEATVRSGHFGLVVGSQAAQNTWPTVAEWVRWREGTGEQPEQVHAMVYEEHSSTFTGVSAQARMLHTAASAIEVGVGLTRGAVELATGAVKGSIELTGEAARALPRLARLGQINPRTRVSFAGILAEQAKASPNGVCFLFEGRAHTYAAVANRIDHVVRGLIDSGVRPAQHVGVLMETRPSGLATVAALSRLGAVAVLLPPGGDLAAGVALTGIDTIVADPEHAADALEAVPNVLVLGGGEDRDLGPLAERVIDLEHVDHAAVRVPGWYRPNPGLARDLAFVLVVGVGSALTPKYVTNYRWAVSAFGTATAADLDGDDTVYCLAPLHHSAGLLVSIGGAVAAGARIALSRTLDPELFYAEVYRYGVTAVTYTWTMMREIVDAESITFDANHPIRLFIGSGMPVGLWRQTLEKFRPAKILEFYASTEGDVVLANVKAQKLGCKGRPVPGTADVELAAYDPMTGRLIEDDRGFVKRCADDEIGLLLGRASSDTTLPIGGIGGVFKAGDAWVPTENLFWRDNEGDYWLADHKDTVIKTVHGPVYTQPVCDVLDEIRGIDVSVCYGLPLGRHDVAVAAVSVVPGRLVTAAEVTEALRGLLPAERPDLVRVVDEVPLSPSFRPNPRPLREQGLPAPGDRCWYYDAREGAYAELIEKSDSDDPALVGLGDKP